MTEETLFHEALARPDPRDRAAFLTAACAGRPDLRSAVEALLAAHESSGAFLDGPAVSDWSDAVSTNAKAGSTEEDRTRTANPATATTAGTGPDAPAEMPDHIGRYAVRSVLGRGGMGTVYLAHDPELDRLVALKVPKLGGPAAEERFLQEARAAAAVSHPNLCPVYDASRADGVPYLAMAYVRGRTLGQALRDDGPFIPARAAALAAGVARGMAEAHRHAIVHRDLKPGNILLDRRGEPVVTDFGLARRDAVPESATALESTAATDPRLTQAGAVIGTPAYMSPEQARGDVDGVGPASDVYSLGAILFEMLTGRVPFRGDTVAETLRKIETDPIPPLPGVPAGLAAVCRKALARDPAARPESMDAFAAALAPFATERRPRWLARAAVAIAAVVLLIAGGVVFYLKTDNGTIEIQLSDPAADVRVTVDGQTVEVVDGQRVVRLRAGKRHLEVTGDGYETDSQNFSVTRGGRQVLTVQLRPKGAPDADRDRLARALNRGKALVDQGRFIELKDVADEALGIDPQSPTALALRATYKADRRDWAGAKADADAALKLNPETSQALIVRVIARAELGEGTPDDGIADLTIAIRVRPAAPVPWANRANLYLIRKEYRQAVADADRAITLGEKGPASLMTRAAARAYLGEFDASAADYTAAAALAPTNVQVYIQRSAVYAAMGKAAEAAADWATAARLTKADLQLRDRPVVVVPKPPERRKLSAAEADRLTAVLAGGNKNWNGDRFEDALKAAEEACAIDPTSAPARSLRARAWGQLGRYADAIAEATEALRLDPTDATALSNRGVARASLKDHAGAIADHTMSLRLSPDNPVAWNNRGFAYIRREQYHQALADLTESVRRRPNYVSALANRATCHLYLGDYPRALADYESAARYQPTVARWRMNCSLLKALLDDPAGADRDRATAIGIDPRLKDAKPPTLPTRLPPLKVDPE